MTKELERDIENKHVELEGMLYMNTRSTLVQFEDALRQYRVEYGGRIDSAQEILCELEQKATKYYSRKKNKTNFAKITIHGLNIKLGYLRKQFADRLNYFQTQSKEVIRYDSILYLFFRERKRKDVFYCAFLFHFCFWLHSLS